MTSGDVAEARERLVSTAYDLFSRYGMQTVGIERILKEAAVAKSTLYRHFPSKEDLIVAALERREKLWTEEWLKRQVEEAGGPPGARLLAIFDAYDRWFHRDDFESCMFLGTLLESHDRRSRVGRDAAKRLAHVSAFVEDLAREAGAGDPKSFALEWQIVMSGSILAATRGDLDAAKAAREVGRMVLMRESIDPGDTR